MLNLNHLQQLIQTIVIENTIIYAPPVLRNIMRCVDVNKESSCDVIVVSITISILNSYSWYWTAICNWPFLVNHILGQEKIEYVCLSMSILMTIIDLDSFSILTLACAHDTMSSEMHVFFFYYPNILIESDFLVNLSRRVFLKPLMGYTTAWLSQLMSSVCQKWVVKNGS